MSCSTQRLEMVAPTKILLRQYAPALLQLLPILLMTMSWIAMSYPGFNDSINSREDQTYIQKNQESQQQPRIQENAWANSSVGDMEADGGTTSEKATNSKKSTVT